MRAWAYTARGTPSQVLKLRHDIPQPQPTDLKPDEVLIKISHVALFAPTVKLMILIPHLDSTPRYPEMGFSGTVVATVDSTSKESKQKFCPGDAVFGMLHPRQARIYNGVLAEYIIIPQSNVQHRPSHIKAEEAAGLGGAGCTSIQFAELSGLLRIDRVPHGREEHIVSTGHGKRVLITAGSGGTGAIMIQIAKMLVGEKGCVVATCSGRNAQTVVELGADEVSTIIKLAVLNVVQLHTYRAV